jgi:hypothetical protein
MLLETILSNNTQAITINHLYIKHKLQRLHTLRFIDKEMQIPLACKGYCMSENKDKW